MHFHDSPTEHKETMFNQPLDIQRGREDRGWEE